MPKYEIQITIPRRVAEGVIVNDGVEARRDVLEIEKWSKGEVVKKVEGEIEVGKGRFGETVIHLKTGDITIESVSGLDMSYAAMGMACNIKEIVGQVAK